MQKPVDLDRLVGTVHRRLGRSSTSE
jgi:hypothetical protein